MIKKLDESGGLREVEVVDFKSDSSLLYKVDHEHQLRLYVMASLEALGLRPRKACIHDLESGEKKYVGIGKNELAETRNELEARISGIRAGEFRHARRKAQCLDCDYRKICRHTRAT